MQAKIFIFLFFFSILIFLHQTSFSKNSHSLIVATASIGGTYYPIGVGIATSSSLHLRKYNITMNAITSAGSLENIELLKNKEADLAILQVLVAFMAWEGKLDNQKKQTHFLSLSALWKDVEHIIISKQDVLSGTIEDLKSIKGTRFSMGKLGSGAEISGKIILNSLGVNTDAFFKMVYGGYRSSMHSLKLGHISGMNLPGGVPVSAITKAFSLIGAKNLEILNFSEEHLQKINETLPIWERYIIPKNTYPKQEKEIKTIAQPNFLAVRKDLNEEVVYLILKNLYDNLPFLQQIHPATYNITLENALKSLKIPLHPGAYKFYLEKGIMIPDELKPPQFSKK